MRLRLTGRGEKVTRAHRRRWMEHDLRGFQEDLRPRVRAYHRKLPFPERMPLLQQIFVDRLNQLWVLRYAPPYSGDPFEFEVFDSEGRPLARASVPFSVLGSRMRDWSTLGLAPLLEIGGDYLLVRARDRLGVQRVEKYRLVKGSGPVR